jgi:hypothetical protein
MASSRNIQFIFGERASHTTAVMQAMSLDNWDRRTEFKVAEFLALGFYFVSNGLRCSTCGRIQSEWIPKENLLVQHCKFNPHCPLVQEFYSNPLINYYFCNTQIMQDLHVVYLDDAMRTAI